MKKINNNDIKDIAILSSILAGKEILAIYESDNFEIEYKKDESPLTIADTKANIIISQNLQKTSIPILSEEGSKINYDERKKWEYFWMIDPLDGTKEFVKKNGEFTVNIALIKNNIPILGVVFSPCLKKLYYSTINGNAYLVNNIDLNLNDEEQLIFINNNKEQLPFKKSNKYKIVASRSHLSDETKAFIAQQKERYSNIEIVSIGSSLKLCLIAEANASIYPRFAPTMEWDTAAGHAIINAAGGRVIKHETKNELEYNKKNLLNPWFIATL